MKTLKFTKMHGLGNDFMVVNAINQDFDPLAAPLAQWADRYRGVGFDQFCSGSLLLMRSIFGTAFSMPMAGK